MLLNCALGKMRRHLTACNRMKFSKRKIDAYKNKNMYPRNLRRIASHTASEMSSYWILKDHVSINARAERVCAEIY